MTIDNLFQKCLNRDTALKRKTFKDGDPPKNFNDMQKSGDHALQ